MWPTVFLSWLGLLASFLIQTEAKYIKDMNHLFAIPCEGDLCRDTLFCWRGARYADLNQIATRVRAQVDFEDEKDTCVDAESEDVLSLRAIAFGGEDQNLEVRLSNRIGTEGSWIRSLVLTALLGQQKVMGDGECHGKHCHLYFSPYHSSCIRLCGPMPTDGRRMNATVKFNQEFALDQRSINMFLIGLGLLVAAPSLSERPAMFYLTGGSVGVIFAVALLVLFASRMATRSGPTKGQLGVAAFMQVGVLYMRKALYEFMQNYVDWIVLYIFVTFVVSLGVVHYFLKGEDGRIRLSSSLKDIVRVALQLLGAFFMASPIPSARMRLFVLISIFTFELVSNFHQGGIVGLLFGRIGESTRKEVKVEEIFADEDEVGARTPQRVQAGAPPPPSRSLSGSRYLTEEEYREQGREHTRLEVAKLFTPPPTATAKEISVLSWLQASHTKLFVRNDEDDDGEGEDEEEDMDEEMEE